MFIKVRDTLFSKEKGLAAESERHSLEESQFLNFPFVQRTTPFRIKILTGIIGLRSPKNVTTASRDREEVRRLHSSQ